MKNDEISGQFHVYGGETRYAALAITVKCEIFTSAILQMRGWLYDMLLLGFMHALTDIDIDSSGRASPSY